MNGDFVSDIILGFPKSKYENITVQQFVLYGYLFKIFISNKKCPKIQTDIFLQESGDLYITTQELTNSDSDKNVIKRLSQPDIKKIFSSRLSHS